MTDEKQPVGQLENGRTYVRALSKRQNIEKVLNGNVDELLSLQKEIVERLEQVITRLNNVSI